MVTLPEQLGQRVCVYIALNDRSENMHCVLDDDNAEPRLLRIALGRHLFSSPSGRLTSNLVNPVFCRTSVAVPQTTLERLQFKEAQVFLTAILMNLQDPFTTRPVSIYRACRGVLDLNSAN